MINLNEPLSASLEDYLEAIFHIEQEKHAARAKDITERLQVSGASVTAALRTRAWLPLPQYIGRSTDHGRCLPGSGRPV